MTSQSPLTSPLAKVRGLGSAKDGTGHWWHQRLTAIVLVPLVLWFVFSFMGLVAHGTREEIGQWFTSPLNAIGLLLLLSAKFYHARLGLQIVVEDYVHCKFKKNLLLILITLSSLALALIGWLAVIKLHLNGI